MIWAPKLAQVIPSTQHSSLGVPMGNSSVKRWYGLIAVEPLEFKEDPPLGEALAEPVAAMLAAHGASSSWTSWTTGNPPDTHPDGGWEYDP